MHTQEREAAKVPMVEDRLNLELAAAEGRLATLRTLAPLQERCHTLRARDVPVAAEGVQDLQRDADALAERLAEARNAAVRADRELQARPAQCVGSQPSGCQ